jgi:hypothetical protein
VIEETPPAVESDPAPPPVASTIPDFRTLLRAPVYPQEPQWDDWLQETLQIAEAEIEIHVVEAVRFETDKHSIRRHRWERTENPDF